MIDQDPEFELDVHCSKDFEFRVDFRLFQHDGINLRLLSASLSGKVRSDNNEGIVFVLRFSSGSSQI